MSRVFISHVHEDADFAKAIAAWLESKLMGAVTCFVSSDDSIPLGHQWSESIQAALNEAVVVLVLFSPTSASRRWIYFEAGAGFGRAIPVVPVCIAGMKLARLEPPLSVLEAIELPDPESERKLLALVARLVGLKPQRVRGRLVLPDVSAPSEAASGDDLRKRRRRRRSPTPAAAPGAESRAERFFRNADDTAFVEFFRSVVAQASRVVLVGTGLNILYRQGPLGLLGARKGQSWEVFVADPYSPSVEARLIEEETGSPKPPVAREGLINRLNTLLSRQAELRDCSVRVFSHYPTISFFIVDKHYFLYPYGFSRLGDYSPVTYCCRDNEEDEPVVRFIDEQYELIKAASVDARHAQNARSGRSFDIRTRDQLSPIALYVVPEGGTELYRFGTRCLGFDLRDQKQVATSWPAPYVKGAAEFGFHLTVADALYFADEWSLTMVRCEIQTIARQFRPFELDYEIAKDFPAMGSVSLRCRDETGTLEALHHEMVFRAYRRAVASNYSTQLGADAATTDRVYATSPTRKELMLKRYHAPYVLSEFRPHFSLVANVEAGQLPGVAASLESELPRPPCVVNTVCLLTRPAGSRHWSIRDEFRLGPEPW
jgi:hypothetical protein